MKAKKLINLFLLVLSGVLIYYLTKEVLEAMNFVIGFILMYGIYNKREISNSSVYISCLFFISIPFVHFLPPGIIWAFLVGFILTSVLLFLVIDTSGEDTIDNPDFFNPINKNLILVFGIFMIALSEHLISYQINQVINNSHSGGMLALGGAIGLLTLNKLNKY